MSEDRMDRIIESAADHYNVPPLNPPLDEMWLAIEQRAFDAPLQSKRLTPLSLATNPWLRLAAVLVVGVAIGRMTAGTSGASVSTDDQGLSSSSTASYQLSTEQYLGQAVALLATLPGQLQSGDTDSSFVARASESLATLRLLMDSPAASNPRLRALFEDLELVLVQVVQMPASDNASDAKLIRQAMQERDVMPRLFDAVADNPN